MASGRVVKLWRWKAIRVGVYVNVGAFGSRLNVVPLRLFRYGNGEDTMFPVFIFRPLGLLFVRSVGEEEGWFIIGGILVCYAKRFYHSP